MWINKGGRRGMNTSCAQNGEVRTLDLWKTLKGRAGVWSPSWLIHQVVIDRLLRSGHWEPLILENSRYFIQLKGMFHWLKACNVYPNLCSTILGMQEKDKESLRVKLTWRLYLKDDWIYLNKGENNKSVVWREKKKGALDLPWLMHYYPVDG